jgi:hypothetical protein
MERRKKKRLTSLVQLEVNLRSKFQITNRLHDLVNVRLQTVLERFLVQ